MSTRWRLPVLLAATFALATACGAAPQENGVASLSGTNQPAADQGKPNQSDADKQQAWAKCMREHGVDAEAKTGPDGKTEMRVQASAGPGDKGGTTDGGPMQEADKACRPLLPNGGVPPKLDAKQLDALRAQAKCMREHGIDVPDPDPNNPGMMIKGGPGDEEKLKAATQACMPNGPDGKGGAVVGGGGGVESAPTK
jgi:hypothetical protein